MQASGSIDSNLVMDYVGKLASRLASDGFDVSRDSMVGTFKVLLLAQKNAFEATKMGRSKRVVAVTSADPPTVQGTKDFLSAALQFSRQNSSFGFLVNQSNWCFPVILCNSVPQDVKQWIEETPGERGNKSIGFPVVVSLTERTINYTAKTPFFGAAYYRGFREFAKKNLGFD